jgi:hypothetical protein
MKPLDLIPKTNAAAYRFHIEMRRGRQPAIIERDILVVTSQGGII